MQKTYYRSIYVEIEISDDMVILEIETIDLYKGRDAKPSIDVTQYTGDDFVRQDQALILKGTQLYCPSRDQYPYQSQT